MLEIERPHGTLPAELNPPAVALGKWLCDDSRLRVAELVDCTAWLPRCRLHVTNIWAQLLHLQAMKNQRVHSGMIPLANESIQPIDVGIFIEVLIL